MMVDQNPKEYFDSIVDAPKEDRSFRIVLFVLFTCIFGWASTIGYILYNNNDKDKQIVDLTSQIIQCHEHCKREVSRISTEKDSLCQATVFAIQKDYNDKLQKRTDELEGDMRQLTERALKLERKTNR